MKTDKILNIKIILISFGSKKISDTYYDYFLINLQFRISKINIIFILGFVFLDFYKNLIPN